MFPDDDFEPESTILCSVPNNYDENTIVENKKNRKEGLSFGDFETIVEEEVDNYILGDNRDERLFSMISNILVHCHTVLIIYMICLTEKIFLT